MAINVRWEEAQPILAADNLQPAVWRMIDYKQVCRKDNAIKLKSSSIVAALLTEEEKMTIFDSVAKMYFSRMEEFNKMTKEDRDKAMQDAARSMAEEERIRGLGENPLSKDVDLSELGL